MRIPALLLFLITAWLAAAGPMVLADDPPAQYGKQDSVVGPLVQQFIEERASTASQQGPQPSGDAVTRGQSADSRTTTKDALGTDSSSSTDSSDYPVRFDSSGNVQVYIHLENTDADTLQELRDLGATVEITNSDVNVVQAWVPISALDQIAELDAVQEITPPTTA